MRLEVEESLAKLLGEVEIEGELLKVHQVTFRLKWHLVTLHPNTFNIITCLTRVDDKPSAAEVDKEKLYLLNHLENLYRKAREERMGRKHLCT